MKFVFWGVFAAGFVACSMFGIGAALKRSGNSWTSPEVLAGAVLGLGILALAVAFAAGVRPKALGSDLSMVVALVSLIGAKVLVSFGSSALAALGR